MESPQRDPRPPTLPTTIQVGPDATHDESAYHILISRMDAIQISPELRYMLHSTISRHHQSILVLTSCRYAHTGWPYLAVLGTTLGPITRHREGQYCTTYIWAISRYICHITTHRAKTKKIAKCHIPYTPNYHILPYLSASFTSALTLHIDTNWKSAIYASSKHNVHNVTHKSVNQKVAKSNKVSHHDYRTDLLVMAYPPWYGLLSPAGWLSLRAMRALWRNSWCPDRLVMAHFAPHDGHISRITQGASGRCFAPAGRPSRTQKCDAYCHNFMRPRRSTLSAVVTEIYPSFLVFHFQVPLSLNFYSYFFKFCRILFY